MEETIKGKEVIAYKGMKFDMTCRDFTYEVGKTYKTDKAKLCKCGFHACLNPRDVLGYYFQEGSRYYKVKLSGEITKCGFEDTKVAATEITILEEINIKEAIKTEWWKNDNVLDLLYYSDGFAIIQRGDKLYNLIDKNGNYLSDEWYYWVDTFHEGFARVQRKDSKWNFIDKKGKILSDEWFIDAYYLDDGFAKVQRTNGEWCIFTKNGIIVEIFKKTETDMEETIKGKHEMEETIKGIEVIAYKGMKSDMSCKGFQYEIGRSYKADKVELCECGFHACLNPRDVLDYYSQSIKSRYFKVKLSGEITKCDFEDTKVAATEITILEEITNTFNEVINTTEWWKNDNVLDLLPWSDGLARIRNWEKKYNFINKQGKLLSEQWFEWAEDFCNGFARVQKVDGLYNFINKNGKFLSNDWFKWSGYFHDGFARVQRFDDTMNFLNKDGKIISKEWFSYVDYFDNGLAVVQRTNGDCNFIDKDGNYLSEQVFKRADYFHDGFARVQRKDSKWNFITKDGKILSDEWFNNIYYFHTDFAKVQRYDKKYNFINKKGKFLSNEWFIDACYLDDGLTLVKRANGEWCNIDKSGTLIKILQ